MLSKEEVIKIGKLARIALSEEEVEKFQVDLSAVLDYVKELDLVDTDGLEIVSSVTGLENVQREDKAVEIDYQADILNNGPEHKEGYYKVRSIL